MPAEYTYGVPGASVALSLHESDANTFNRVAELLEPRNQFLPKYGFDEVRVPFDDGLTYNRVRHLLTIEVASLKDHEWNQLISARTLRLERK